MKWSSYMTDVDISTDSDDKKDEMFWVQEIDFSIKKTEKSKKDLMFEFEQQEINRILTAAKEHSEHKETELAKKSLIQAYSINKTLTVHQLSILIGQNESFAELKELLKDILNYDRSVYASAKSAYQESQNSSFNEATLNVIIEMLALLKIPTTESQQLMAEIHEQCGEHLASTSNKALIHYLNAIEILQQLEKETSNIKYTKQIAGNFQNCANISDNAEKKLEYLQKALEIYQRLNSSHEHDQTIKALEEDINKLAQELQHLNDSKIYHTAVHAFEQAVESHKLGLRPAEKIFYLEAMLNYLQIIHSPEFGEKFKKLLATAPEGLGKPDRNEDQANKEQTVQDDSAHPPSQIFDLR